MKHKTTKLSQKKDKYSFDIREYVIASESIDVTRLCHLCGHTVRSRDIEYPVAVDIAVSQLYGYNRQIPLLNGIAVYCPHCDSSYLLNEFGHVMAYRYNERPYQGEAGSYDYNLPMGYNTNRNNIPLGEISFEPKKYGLVKVVSLPHYYSETIDIRHKWTEYGKLKAMVMAMQHMTFDYNFPEISVKTEVVSKQKFETDSRHEFLGLFAVESRDYRELF